MVLNGSFVTAVPEPNDVDCVLLIGLDFPKDAVARLELRVGLPFLEIQVVDQVDFDRLTEIFFATDRNLSAKGMVEVLL